MAQDFLEMEHRATTAQIGDRESVSEGVQGPRLVGQSQAACIRRVKAITVDALNDLPEAARDMLSREFGVRPTARVRSY